MLFTLFLTLARYFQALCMMPNVYTILMQGKAQGVGPINPESEVLVIIHHLYFPPCALSWHAGHRDVTSLRRDKLDFYMS